MRIEYNWDMADFERPADGEEYIEVPDDRTESEREYDRQIERLDSFFAGVQPGVTLLIERLKPTWCSGLLEEITVTDEVIDLQYFIDNWGGQLLSVKVRGKGGRLQGSYKVPLNSYPPLRYGEKIYPFDKGERFRERDEDMPSNQPVVVNTPPQNHSIEKIIGALPAILPFVMKWFENQEVRRRDDMALMLKMSQNSGVSDITKVGAAMSQLSEMFRKNGAGGDGGGGSELDFIPQALDVLKMVLQPAREEKAPQTKGRLTPPAISPPARRATVTQLPTQAATATSSSSSAPSPTDLAGNISAMSPDVAAETIIEALGRMDAGKREAAIGHFLGEWQSTMGNDDDDLEGEDEQDTRRGYR
jgi:hypothetical protein